MSGVQSELGSSEGDLKDQIQDHTLLFSRKMFVRLFEFYIILKSFLHYRDLTTF